MYTMMRNTPTRPSNFINKDRRFAHRAPDLKFLQEAENVRYDEALYPMRNCYGKSVINSKCNTMSHFPELMGNYLKVAAVMRERNLIPFIHGEPPGLNGIRLFMHNLIKPKGKESYYKYFRRPTPAFDIDRAELVRLIDQYTKDNGLYFKPKLGMGTPTFSWGAPMLSPLDQDQNLRPHLMALSYAMTANMSNYDSCFWFIFHHRKGMNRIKSVFAETVTHSLKIRGQSKELISKYILEMDPIFNAYAELKVGTLAVIGIPEDKVSQYVYDSKSMGHPTGTDIRKVIENPFAESTDRLMGNDGGLQARLMLYNETMSPSSGIQVIIANDDNEVGEFCRGIDLIDPKKVGVFKKILCKESTSIEMEDKQRRKELEEKIITILRGLASDLK
jgi:hypothetical protein